MASNLRRLLSLISSSQPKLGLVQGLPTQLSSFSQPWTRSFCSMADGQPLSSTQPSSKNAEANAADKVKSKEESEQMESRGRNDDELEEEGGFVNKATGEVGGPRGPEPTRYGDWERKGRCSDF